LPTDRARATLTRWVGCYAIGRGLCAQYAGRRLAACWPTTPVLDYVARLRREHPRGLVTIYIPEYVVGRWWEQLLHNQSALPLKARLLFERNVMVTSVPWQLASSHAEERRTVPPDEISRPCQGPPRARPSRYENHNRSTASNGRVTRFTASRACRWSATAGCAAGPALPGLPGLATVDRHPYGE
jgi:hypothetical protein